MRTEERLSRIRGQINITPHGVDFGDFAGIQRYARMLIEAGICPIREKDGQAIETPQQHLARATACIILGRRVGIAPEEAVQCIYVVNGRAQLFGDAPLALVRQSELWEESGFKESYEGEFPKKDFRAVCITKRKGGEARRQEFSIADAEQANLWSKKGPWHDYPKRMLMFRARGLNLRDNFGDVLKGIGIKETEEVGQEPVNDTPPDKGRVDLHSRPDRLPVGNGHKQPEPSAPQVSEQQLDASRQDAGSAPPAEPAKTETALAKTLRNAVENVTGSADPAPENAAGEMASVAASTADAGPGPMDQEPTILPARRTRKANQIQ